MFYFSNDKFQSPIFSTVLLAALWLAEVTYSSTYTRIAYRTTLLVSRDTLVLPLWRQPAGDCKLQVDSSSVTVILIHESY